MPKCFIPRDYVGYQVKAIQNSSKNEIKATLERQIPSGLPNEVTTVSVTISQLSNTALRVRITDQKSSRWEPPIPRLNLPSEPTDTLYKVELSQEGNYIK